MLETVSSIALMIAIAESDSGTRCSFRAFMRDAGTVHMRASRSISARLASSTSDALAAVRIVNSSARAAVPSTREASP